MKTTYADYCHLRIGQLSRQPQKNNMGSSTQEGRALRYYVTLASHVRPDLVVPRKQAAALDKVIVKEYAGAYSSGLYLSAGRLADLLNAMF